MKNTTSEREMIPRVKSEYLDWKESAPIKLFSQSHEMVEAIVSARLIIKLAAKLNTAAIITLSVIAEMKMPMEMKAEPKSSIARTFPKITPQSGEAIKESTMPSIIYPERHIASITNAERNLAQTIEAILTGEVRST